MAETIYVLNKSGENIDLTTDQAAAMAITGLSGFNRLDSSTLGLLQFCYSAVSGEIHQIDKAGVYTKLTAQTTFADGVTAIADRTIAIYHSPTEADFSYYWKGALVTVSGLKTLQLADNGGGYVYFDASGDLQTSTVAFDLIVQNSLIAYVGWNTTEAEFNYFADERHGISMNPVTHLYAHSTRGFAWAKMGSDITGLTDNGNTFTAVTSGMWADEDVEHILAEASSAPFIWKEGADGQWRYSVASTALGYIPTATLVWNNEDSGGVGVWGLDDATSNNDYMVTTFWASNNVLSPIVKTVSQFYFGSRNDARDQLPYIVNKTQTDGLPSPELSPIGSMIIHVLAAGQIEKGSDDEIWIDHRYISPVGRFI